MRTSLLLLISLLGSTSIFAQHESTSIYAVSGMTSETPENAPKGSIKGTVTTADGKPAGFVTVVIRELNKGTTTNEDGTFTIKNIKPGAYTLSVSSLGLKPQEKNVTITADKGLELTISLEETAKQLAEFVVDGRHSQNDKPLSISKLGIPVMDLPQAVTVIGQGVIRDQQAQRLSDVIKNVNGVYLQSTRAGTQETFAARGYGFSSNNMFKNGSRVNTGVMPEMSSLERVEVLKGSAAILFGNVAPGGVLNMVTKQPKFEGGGEVSMRVGSYDLFKPAFDIYGPINGSVAYRVNGTYETANSFRDVVSSKRYYINPSLLFKLNKKTELLVQGDYLKHDFTPDFGIGSIDNTRINNLPRNTFLGAPWQYTKTQQTTTGATIKHEVNKVWSFTGTLSYQKYKRDYFSTERIQAKADSTWTRPLGKSVTDEDYYYGQFDVTAKFKTGKVEHTVVGGVDADKYRTKAYTFDQPATYDVINVYDPSKGTRRTDIPVANLKDVTISPVTRFGAYVQDLISVSEKIKVLAGIRWSYVETGRPVLTNLKTGAVTKNTVPRFDKAFSPRLGLVYKPIPTTAVFVSYSNSFTPNTGYDVDSNAIKPSVINQYEAGIKNDFFQGKLSANLTVYSIRNSNLAQTAPYLKNGDLNTSNTNIKALSGETVSNGVEIDIAGHPLPGLDIIAGYSYNDIYVASTPGTFGSLIKGDRLINNPHHTANASVFYTLPCTQLKGLKVGATAFYTGDRQAGWNNTNMPTVPYNRAIDVKGYTQIDLSAGYSFRNISLLAKVSNITNVYNYSVHENYSVNPIAPTQFTGTIAYRFKY